jgi:protein-disulfide isomerase
MPSGKTSRELRRSPRVPAPPVRPKGGPGRRRASPRVLLAAGAIVVAAVAAAVLAVVLTGGSSSPPKNVPAVGSLANGLPGAGEVQALLKGVPQNGLILGQPSAPVTMVEYVDLQCPYCQQFETQVMPGVIRRYVRTGKLKVQLRPWAFIGPDSVRGQRAVLAAARQNKAFNYAELLYDNQATENTGWLSDSLVTSAAASIPGLRVPELLSDRDSAPVKAAAKTVDAQVQADGVSATPTIFVGKSGTHGTEVKLSSPTDAQTLVSAINAAAR